MGYLFIFTDTEKEYFEECLHIEAIKKVLPTFGDKYLIKPSKKTSGNSIMTNSISFKVFYTQILIYVAYWPNRP